MEIKEKIARKNILRKGIDIQGVRVKGYDFNQGVDYTKLLESFSTTGFQADHFSKAISIIKKMIKNDAKIFLGYTSNMVSSGLREIFRYLVEHKKINLIVTTAGGVEEDIIKCLGDFIVGDFRASGKELRKKGINRIGNIFVSNNRYIEFEKWVQALLEELHEESRKTKKLINPSDIIWAMGRRIRDKRSICYWAWKNKIRIYCPALSDGALGDNIYFFKHRHRDFVIDITEDTKRLNDATIGLNKLGLIILGAGVVKHSLLNAAMLRNGADYAVYINTSQEYDGSDSGAEPDEAVSWGKILPDAESVKVFGDATILFPLIAAESFAGKRNYMLRD